MKPITIVAICVICAATLMSGCVDERAEEPRVVYVEREPEIEWIRATPAPTIINESVELNVVVDMVD